MALPENTPLDWMVVTCHTPSAGSTPIAVAAYAPVRGTIKKLFAVLHGTLTGDATCACTINGTAITDGTLSLTASGSVNGTRFEVTPTGANVVNAGDAVTFPVTGGSGSNIACQFGYVLERN